MSRDVEFFDFLFTNHEIRDCRLPYPLKFQRMWAVKSGGRSWSQIKGSLNSHNSDKLNVNDYFHHYWQFTSPVALLNGCYDYHMTITVVNEN